jgi:DNA-binding transcriptional ArsR family regulator
MHRGTDEGELASFTVSEIGERFNISLSTVSHHLQELKRVGLLKMERRGKERYYQVDIDNIIEQVGILYQRLLKKRELIRQGIQVCPQEYLVEYFNRRLSKETVNDKD